MTQNAALWNSSSKLKKKKVAIGNNINHQLFTNNIVLKIKWEQNIFGRTNKKEMMGVM